MKRYVCALICLMLMIPFAASAITADEVYITADFMDTAELMGIQSPGDGTYMEIWAHNDATITICIQPAGYYDAEGFAQLLSDDVRDIKPINDAQVAGRAARRLTYNTGDAKNGDANMLMCFDEADLSLAVLISLPISQQSELEDAALELTNSMRLMYISAQQGFSWEIASEFTHNLGINALGDVITAYQPERYYWMIEDDDALIDMAIAGGTLAVKAQGAAEYLDEARGFDGVEMLPEGMSNLKCEFAYAVWESAEYPVAPIAGIYVGASRDDVLNAMPDAEVFTPEQDDFIETIVCAVYGDMGEYYELEYYIEDGAVICVMLSSLTD